MFLFSLFNIFPFLSQAQWEASREALLTTPWEALLSQHPPLPCGPASTAPSWTSQAQSTARCAACPVVKNKTPPPWQTAARVSVNLFSKPLPVKHLPHFLLPLPPIRTLPTSSLPVLGCYAKTCGALGYMSKANNDCVSVVFLQWPQGMLGLI